MFGNIKLFTHALRQLSVEAYFHQRVRNAHILNEGRQLATLDAMHVQYIHRVHW